VQVSERAIINYSYDLCFPIQNGLRQGDALSPLPFNFALEYAIRKVQENQVGNVGNFLNSSVTRSFCRRAQLHEVSPVRDSCIGSYVKFMFYIQGVNKYMLQCSVVYKWVQSDHILLIHPCPETLVLRARMSEM
jgi:hypothetical protein